MSSVRRKSKLKPSPPVTWPAWTDDHVWQLGPGPEDAGPFEAPSDADRDWAARHLNEEPEEMPDDILDALAGLHVAMVRLERGIKD